LFDNKTKGGREMTRHIKEWVACFAWLTIAASPAFSQLISFSRDSDPMVKDTSTSLVWADKASPADLFDSGSGPLISAPLWAKNLNGLNGGAGYGGYTGWHLATAAQMVYLLSHDLNNLPGNTTNFGPFTHLNPNVYYYWSSTFGPQNGEAYLWNVASSSVVYDLVDANTGEPQGAMAVRGTQTSSCVPAPSSGAFSAIEIPPAGNGSYATTPPIGLALNSCGDITGGIDPYYTDSEFTISPHVFLYSKGVTTDIGPLGNSCGALGNAINAGDFITGSDCPSTEFPTPTLTYNGGINVSIPLPSGAYEGAGSGINSTGVIVGTFGTSIAYSGCVANYYHSFLYNTNAADSGTNPNSGFQDLGGVIGPCGSQATAINDAAEIVGYFNDLGNNSHAFLYDSVARTGVDLGNLLFTSPPPYCPYSAQATGISSDGSVTGYSQGDCSGPEAFLYTNGDAAIGERCYPSNSLTDSSPAEICDIGNLGGLGGSVGNGVNASGQVVGQSWTANNAAQHAFLFSNNTIIDLNSWISENGGCTSYSNDELVACTLVDALAIDDAGQILALGYLNSDPSQTTVTFLITPLPAALTASLGATSVDGSGNYVVNLVLADAGGAPANMTKVTAATLIVVERGKPVTTAASTIADSQSNLAPGASSTYALTFPPTAGAAGASATMRWSASSSSGSVTGTLRLTLP
jgi:probable HAF family extracellular repeat protein